ncbi:MAG TPA: hypothetical protein VF796_28675 [Humisphaera sp.]
MSTDGWRHNATVDYGADPGRRAAVAPRSVSRLGLVSLAAGIAAASVAWVPVVGLVGGTVAAAGVLVGAAGVMTSTGGRRGVGVPVAGILACFCGVGLAVGFNRFADAWWVDAAPAAVAADPVPARPSERQTEAAADVAARAKLPPFEFLHNDLSDARGTTVREVVVEATGDVDESDVHGIVDYVARFRPAGRMTVEVTARANGLPLMLGSGRIWGPDKDVQVSPAHVQAYRKAAGLPATRPARRVR